MAGDHHRDMLAPINNLPLPPSSSPSRPPFFPSAIRSCSSRPIQPRRCLASTPTPSDHTTHNPALCHSSAGLAFGTAKLYFPTIRSPAFTLPHTTMDDISFDTTWCPVCSRQILPKRYYVPIQPQPQAPAVPPSSPTTGGLQPPMFSVPR